ncbi:MAG: hypothetical protein CVU11_06415 [Bacteroidetes bacterium HGW-Bacteroidetes-6]|jgi:Tfp pilus assembly protein PilV|nr:MAG: hypothetical protein CVU11_06415 [Bacteroidetes bacterium HGW-Bacteroidetes-6]
MKSTVAGTTLIETLVASVIILTVVGISSMIIAGSFRSHSSMPQLQAIGIADSLHEQIVEDGAFSEREFSHNNLNFNVSFSSYPAAKNIVVMTVDVRNGLNQSAGSFKYLIPDY